MIALYVIVGYVRIVAGEKLSSGHQAGNESGERIMGQDPVKPGKGKVLG